MANSRVNPEKNSNKINPITLLDQKPATSAMVASTTASIATTLDSKANISRPIPSDYEPVKLLSSDAKLICNIFGGEISDYYRKSQQLLNAVIKHSNPPKKAHCLKMTFQHYLDPIFAEYGVPANRIGKTQYIATQGRSSCESIGHFFKNIFFNKQMPATIVVRLGYCEYGTLAVRSPRQDFSDYTLDGKYDQFEVVSVIENAEDLSVSTATQRIRKTVTTTQLKVTRQTDNVTKEVMVYDFPIPDGGYFQDSNKLEFKKFLYKLYQASAKENIAVHCAAGVGRTGYFLFTFLILDYFEEIFYHPTKKPLQQLLQVFAYLRTSRNAAVTNVSQFCEAIKLAIVMREYEDIFVDVKDKKDRTPRSGFPTFLEIEKETDPLIYQVIVNGHSIEAASLLFSKETATQTAAASTLGFYSQPATATASEPKTEMTGATLAKK